MKAIMDPINAKDHHTFTMLIHQAIDTCNQCIFKFNERKVIIELLVRLQEFRKYYSYNDSSLSNILDEIDKRLQDSHLSQLSLDFLQEKLRIEKLYLGPCHADIASTLYRIGQVYAENEQAIQASEYFLEALFLLKERNKKGEILALTLFNLGLIQYKSSPVDAMKIFHCSIKAKEDALGEFHPTVAEMHLTIGRLQLQTGMRDNAMHTFLQALMILRMSNGNNSEKVGEILYHIGLCHKERSEYIEALNSLYQSMEIAKQFQCKETIIMILHKISLVYQCMKDYGNAINITEEMIDVIKQEQGENNICVAVVLGHLCSLYAKQGMMEESEKVLQDIDTVCTMHGQTPSSNNNSFAEFIIGLFGYVMEDNSSIIVPVAA